MAFFKTKNTDNQFKNDFYNTILSSGTSNSFVTEKQAMQLPTLKACISLIENTIASLPIKMKRKQGNNIEYVYNNPYLMMLNNPNNIDTAATLKKQLVHELLLYGRAYLYVNKNQLHVLKSNFVKEEFLTNTGFTVDAIKYRYELESSRVLETENVIRFSYGEGILSNDDILQTAINSQNLNKTMLENGTFTTGVLKSATRLTEKAIKNLRASWENLYSGINKNKTVILEEGLDYQPLSLNPDELQLNATEKALTSKICMLFNVSESLINDSSNKYDSLATANTNFLQKTISPILNVIESTLNKHFFDNDNVLFVFDTSQVLKATEIENIEATKMLFNDGLISFNEARKRINYNVIDDEQNYYQLNIGKALRNAKTGEILNINTQLTSKTTDTSKEVDTDKNNLIDTDKNIDSIEGKEKEVI